MMPAEGFEVSTADLRSHATAIDGFGGRADTAADAADHLASLNDAYGLLCQPFGQMVQEPQLNGATALRSTAKSISRMAELVTAAADGYDEVDTEIAKDFEQALNEVESVQVPRAQGGR